MYDRNFTRGSPFTTAIHWDQHDPITGAIGNEPLDRRDHVGIGRDGDIDGQFPNELGGILPNVDVDVAGVICAGSPGDLEGLGGINHVACFGRSYLQC